jgi:hypothetical protein
MMQIPIPRDIEVLAAQSGTSIARACKNAGLTRDVFTRWKRGVGKGGIGIENLRKIVDQLELAISESTK